PWVVPGNLEHQPRPPSRRDHPQPETPPRDPGAREGTRRRRSRRTLPRRHPRRRSRRVLAAAAVRPRHPPRRKGAAARRAMARRRFATWGGEPEARCERRAVVEGAAARRGGELMAIRRDVFLREMALLAERFNRPELSEPL